MYISNLVKNVLHFCENGEENGGSLRSLKTGITPVNFKLKNIIKTPRSYEIIKKAETVT